MVQNIRKTDRTRSPKVRMLLIFLIILFGFLCPGIYLLRRYQQIDENFLTTELFTGDLSEMESIIGAIDIFDFESELNLSGNDFPHKIANYSTSSLPSHYAEIVRENREQNWWKPFHSSYMHYYVHFESFDLFNITFFDGPTELGGDDSNFGTSILYKNTTDMDYSQRHFSFEDAHWYINNSFLPNEFPIVEPLSFSSVHLVSIEFRYGFGKGMGISEAYYLDQQVLLGENLDIIWIFVDNLTLAVA